MYIIYDLHVSLRAMLKLAVVGLHIELCNDHLSIILKFNYSDAITKSK